MALKRYQETVLAEVQTYLDALVAEQQSGNIRHAALDAWHKCRNRAYIERQTGHGRDLPMFCLKVPTGGGKTLLATQILAQAYKTLLPERNGAGLVLWVVPSDQIYKDTLKALRDRTHFYRESLEIALSRRIEVWEKDEINRLTPGQLASNLNILIVKLQGTKRQDKESLKFFRDSGGPFTANFPAENEPEAHRSLKERFSNLEMIEEDAATGNYLAATSVANFVRICEPVVILDEGQKAVSELAREAIRNFNPRLVVELSATPPVGANVLCQVSGQQLLDEEMIKLPINIATSGEQSWEHCLTKASDKRQQLAEVALEYYKDSQALIRPIVLVQVERIGKEQRDSGFIHAEDVREYLIGRLGIPEESVKLKTSEHDEIAGIDLMDDECRIEWIITKAALQEGWDCPFAYILVSLSNTRNQMSMTQLVGRVLRQPFQKKTPFPELNESYVYCLKRSSAQVVADVRAALEKEGYEGNAQSVVDGSNGGNGAPEKRIANMRFEFRERHRKPFKGHIFLPRFCVKTSSEVEALDYFRHLLNSVDVLKFDYDAVTQWDFKLDLAAAKEQFYRINLNEEALEPLDVRTLEASALESDYDAKSWLVANLQMDWYSAKRLREIVDNVCARLVGVEGQLSLVRFRLLEKLSGFIQRQTDLQTEALFQRMHDEGQIVFFLERVECSYEIPQCIQRHRIKALVHDDNSPVKRTLFDFQPDEDNDYEKNVALFLDNHPQVLWWYRNIVGLDEFNIQGPRRNRIYPDFVVQQSADLQPRPTVLVVESKGGHLRGNLDTEYKRTVAKYFEDIGKLVTWQEVTWRELGQGFDKHCFRFQILDEGDYRSGEWRDDLDRMLNQANDSP